MSANLKFKFFIVNYHGDKKTLLYVVPKSFILFDFESNNKEFPFTAYTFYSLKPIDEVQLLPKDMLNQFISENYQDKMDEFVYNAVIINGFGKVLYFI